MNSCKGITTSNGGVFHIQRISSPKPCRLHDIFVIAVDVEVRFGGDESPKELVANVQQYPNMDHSRFCFG